MPETDVITLPAYWASALINGDDSSFDLMDDEDAARERAALLQTILDFAEDGWTIVDTDGSEPHFTNMYHLYHPDPGDGVTGGDVLGYVVIKD